MRLHLPHLPLENAFRLTPAFHEPPHTKQVVHSAFDRASLVLSSIGICCHLIPMTPSASPVPNGAESD